jgi:uncharacterized membrane protein YgcG
MQPAPGGAVLGSPPAPKHPIAFIFHWAFKVREKKTSVERRASAAPERERQTTTPTPPNRHPPPPPQKKPTTKQIASIVFYVLCEALNRNSFVANFVVCVVLLAADFWTTKNVTGRLLVGLRWWNDVSPDGSGSEWRFESLNENQRVVDQHESRGFWAGLIAAPALWGIAALAALIGLDWGYLLIPVIGVVLSASNLVGYYKCSNEAKKQLQSAGASLMASAVASRLGFGGGGGWFGGGGAAAAGGAR